MIDVRKVWPRAIHRQCTDGTYEVTAAWADGTLDTTSVIGHGDTPKQAWWNARENALAHVLGRD